MYGTCIHGYDAIQYLDNRSLKERILNQSSAKRTKYSFRDWKKAEVLKVASFVFNLQIPHKGVSILVITLEHSSENV